MKKLRIFLSVAAVMFAVAGAFSTSAYSSKPLVANVSTLNHPQCQVRGTCDESGSAVCKMTSGTQVYKIVSSPTLTCNTEILGNFTAN